MASRDVPPFCVHDGRNWIRTLNLAGLRRIGLETSKIRPLQEAFKLIFRSGKPLAQALAKVETTYGESPEVLELLSFIRSARRGIGTGRQPATG